MHLYQHLIRIPCSILMHFQRRTGAKYQSPVRADWTHYVQMDTRDQYAPYAAQDTTSNSTVAKSAHQNRGSWDNLLLWL